MPRDNSDLDPLFYAAGQANGIDPFLLKSVAMVESGMNRNTPDSYQDAQGLMQIIPRTARALGVTDPRDPAQAIPAAARYLAEGYDKTGSAAGAVMYYHGGPNRNQWGPKTQAYVGKVAGNYANMKNQPDPYADIIKKYTSVPAASSPSAADSPPAAAGSSVPAAGGNDDPYADIIKKYTAAPSTARPSTPQPENDSDAGQKSIAANVGTPLQPSTPETWQDKYKAANEAVSNRIAVLPHNIAASTVNAYNASKALAEQGALQTGGLDLADPSTYWAAVKGAAKTLGGTAGMAGSPLAGVVNPLVVDPVTQATGSPLIGERAGVVAGAALPAPIVAGANRLISAAAPVTRAGKVVNELVTPEATARLEANPNLALADVNPAARNLAAGLGVNKDSPVAQNIINQAVEARKANAPAVVQGALDTSMGAQPDVPALLSQMKQTASQNAARGFGEALQGAKPVDLTGMPQAYLDKIAKTAEDLKNQNPDFALLSQPEQHHRVQSELRTQSETLKGGMGNDILTGRAIGNVRGQLVDRIDQATGGKFKPAQAQYADDMAVQNAFDKGQSVFQSSNKDIENRPEFWQKTVDAMTPAERDALKLGARTAADNLIGEARNAATKGGALSDIPFNQARLEAVLGPTEAKSLISKLQDARDVATTNTQITAGSMTANKQQGAAATEVRKPSGINLTEGMGLPVGNELLHGNHLVTAGLAGYNLGKYGLGRVGQALDAARNAELARVLMQPGMTGINRLSAAPPQIPYLPPAIWTGRNQMTQGKTPPPGELPLLANMLLRGQ